MEPKAAPNRLRISILLALVLSEVVYVLSQPDLNLYFVLKGNKEGNWSVWCNHPSRK
jgi:plasmid maintenance system killer protein